MRRWGLGLAFLLAGCSTGSVDSGAALTTPQAAVVERVTATVPNASAVAAVVLVGATVDRLLPQGSDGLPAVSSDDPNSSALALALAVKLRGAGTFQSPLGGSWTVDDQGNAQFQSLHTPRSVIDGSMSVMGTQASFGRVTLTSPEAAVALTGSAQLTVDGDDLEWTSNMALAHLSGPAVTLQNFVVSLKGGQLSMGGGMVFRNAHAISGLVQVDTLQPLSFDGNVLTGGSLSINGGQMRIDAASGGNVTLQVGTTSVKTVSYGYLGGALNFGPALRLPLADRIFTNANVLTMENQVSDSLAVGEGRILALGAQTASFQGPATQVVDLHGQTLLPGFIEANFQLTPSALSGLDCSANTLAAVRAALAQAVAAGPVYGVNFDPSRLVGSDLMQALTRSDLDAISSTVPIVVRNASLHIAYANTPALQAAGLLPAPPSLANLVLPSGQVNEAAQKPLLQVVLAGRQANLRPLLDQAAAAGVTTVCDFLTGATLGLEAETAQLADQDADTPVRIRSYLDSSQVSDLSQLNIFPGEGNGRVHYLGAGFVMDGSAQGLTAGISFPYLFPGPYPMGLLNFGSAASVLAPWQSKGFQLALECNGDAAIGQACSALGQLAATGDPRFRLEHFSVHTDLAQDVANALSLQAEVSLSVTDVSVWGDVLRDTVLGAVSRSLAPLASLQAAGVSASVQSDVLAINPLGNLSTCASRLTPSGQVLGPEQQVSRADALQAVTLRAAHACLLEAQVGSLVPGKLADLVVLDGDPTQVDPASLRVKATYLEGSLVSGAP